MPTTIADSMPEDWLVDGAIARGCEPDDLDLRHAMTEAYERGLVDLGVANIVGMLKNLTVNAAGKITQEDAPEQPTDLPPANHELHAESVTSTSDAA